MDNLDSGGYMDAVVGFWDCLVIVSWVLAFVACCIRPAHVRPIFVLAVNLPLTLRLLFVMWGVSAPRFEAEFILLALLGSGQFGWLGIIAFAVGRSVKAKCLVKLGFWLSVASVIWAIFVLWVYW